MPKEDNSFHLYMRFHSFYLTYKKSCIKLFFDSKINLDTYDRVKRSSFRPLTYLRINLDFKIKFCS